MNSSKNCGCNSCKKKLSNFSAEVRGGKEWQTYFSYWLRIAEFEGNVPAIAAG